MATRVIAAQDKTSSGAGDDVQIKAGNANTSGAGGSIILQPGSQVTTGGDGFVQIKGTGSSTILKLTESAYNRSFTWTQDYAGASLSADGGLGGVTIFNKFFVSNYFSNIRAAYNSYVGLGNSNDQNYDNWGFIYLRNDGVVNWWGNAGLTYGSVGTIRVSNASTGGGSLAYTSSTPTALSTNPTNDLVLTGSAFQRLSSSSALSVTGIAPPATGSHVDGRLIWLYNVGSFNITLKHSQTSTAANQFINEGSGDIVLGPGRMVQAIYDSTSSKWRVNGETYPYVFPTADGTNGQVLTTNGSGTLSWTTVSAGASASGTTNYIAKFTGASALGSSLIFDNGTNVGIGNTTPSTKLEVTGTIRSASASLAGVLEVGNDGGLTLTRDNSYDLTLAQSSSSSNGLYLSGAGNVYVCIDNNNNETGRKFVVSNNAVKATNEIFYVNEEGGCYVSGNLGVNNTSPGAKLQVDTGATGTKGQIIKAFLGQSANLSEWQNSSGTVNSWINSSGNEFSTNGINLTSYTTSYIKFDTSGQGLYRTNSWMGVGGANFGSGFFIEASNYGRPNIRSAYPAGNGEDSIILNTTTSLVSSLSRIATFQNNGTTGAYILRDGDGVFSGVRVGTGASGTGNAILGGNSNSVNTGNYNTLIGWEALYNKVAGANNVAVGADAGYFQADGSTALTTTSNSIYIGALCRGFSNSDSNSIVIGYQAIGKGANTTVIGNTSSTESYVYGDNLYLGNGAGSQANIRPLARTTSGAGSSLVLWGANGVTSGNGGSVSLVGGYGPSGNGGDILLRGGDSGGGTRDGTVISKGGGSGNYNCHEFRYGIAATYAFFDQLGRFCITPGTSTTAIPADATIYAATRSSATRGLIVKGAASQSANLTEWQDSTGTVVAAVSPTGAFTGSSFTPYGTINSTTTIFGNNYWTPNYTGGVTSPSAGTYTKSTGNNASWDAQVYSSEGYTKNVYCAARASQTNGYIMFGLNEDTANSSYNTIDYAWYFIGDGGSLSIYENGTQFSGSYGSYTTSTVLSITYDGENVRYWKDGALMRTVARSTGNPLYFDTSFYSVSASLNSVQFGPIGQPFGISGTAGYHPKFTSQQTLGNSIVYDNGTNVGIGTTSTTGKLTVANTGKQLTLKAYDGSQNNTVSFEAIRANYSDAASVLAIYTNSGSSENERVRIMHTGEMGIGTQSPGGMLDVQQSNAGDMLVRAWNTSTAGTGKSIVRIANSGNNAQGQQIQFSDNNYYTGTISSDRTNGLAFYVGQMASPLASERMRIDTSGNVGIGTASPDWALSVKIPSNGTTNGIKVEDKNSTNAIAGLTYTNSHDEGCVVLYKTNVLKTYLRANGDSYFNGGNLGVGTSSPSSKFDVSTGTGANFRAAFAATNQVEIGNYSAASGYREIAVAGSQVYFQTNTAGSTGVSTRMLIDSSGNVGIGTTSPNMALHVVGAKAGDVNEGQGQINVESTAAYNATNGTAFSTSGAGGSVVFRGKYTSGGAVTGFAGIAGSKENTTDGNYGGNLRFYTRSHGANDPPERMRIDSSGNVGIGTSSPSYRLHISGPGANNYEHVYVAATTTVGAGLVLQASGSNKWAIVSTGSTAGQGNNKLLFYYNGATDVAAFDSSGNFGIGNVSPGARLQVDTGAIGTKGQIIKAVASQTANLSEWQNNSGTALSYVASNGDIYSTTSFVHYSSGNSGYYLKRPSDNATVASLTWSSGSIETNLYALTFLNLDSSGAGIRMGSWTTWADSVNAQVMWLKNSNIIWGNNALGVTGRTAFNTSAFQITAGSYATIPAPTSRFEVYGDSQFLSQSTSAKTVIVKAAASQTANLTEWQNNGGTALAYMDANGNFAAVTKSFLIPHPTPAKAAEGKKLRYASLEGPENGVYFRGRLEGENVIILPDYWVDLVDPDSITVNLTARKFAQPSLFVVDANAERVVIESDRQVCCDFIVYATRKDIAKLEVEPDGN